MRAALGASPGALRRTLLAESLVLCGAGAVLGVLLARPLVAVVARYAARFSVRALEVTVDASVLWVGAGLAMAAAVLLAYVPRLPSPHAPTGLGLASGSVCASRRARTAACVCSRRRRSRSRSCCSRARACCSRRSSRCRRRRPATTCGRCWRSTSRRRRPASASATRKMHATSMQESDAPHRQLPGVDGVALGSFVPVARRRHVRSGLQFTVEGYTPADGEENPARAAAHRRAAVLRRARRADHRRPRLHRRRPPRQRAGGDRQPEHRAAAVSGRRRGEPQRLVDRPALGKPPVPRASSASSPTWTTRTSMRGPAMTDLSPGSADAASPAACSCAPRAIPTRWCRR